MFLRRARWATDKYILLMLGVFPLFCGVRLHAYETITASKFYFFAAATGAWVAAVTVLLLAGAARGERYRVRVRPAHLAMAAFLIVGGISALASDYGEVCLLGAERYDGFLTTAMYAAIFFGVSFLSRPAPRYMWALGASSAICCVIALLQIAGFDPFALYPVGTNYYDKYEALNGAFLGTIGNAGLLAAYLCLAGPSLIVFAVLSDRRRDAALLLPGALALCVLVLCDVDAGLVALAGCELVTVPVVIRNRRAGRIAGWTAGGLTAAGLTAVYLWPGTSGTLWELSRVLHGELSDSFGTRRGEIWKRCWELFLERPWLGGGPGTAGRRIDIHWSRYIEALGRERRVLVGNTHNVYLGYLVNLGVFGAASYIAAAVCSMATWLRRRREGALYPALGAAFLCYMIQDFFGLGLCLTAPMLFVVWGLLESADEAEDGTEGETDAIL